MRDPHRIDRVLAQLREYWVANPDLRLGQILENARSLSSQRATPLFVLEDAYIEEGLQRLQGQEDD